MRLILTYEIEKMYDGMTQYDKHPGRMGIFEGGEKQHLTLSFSSSYLIILISKTEQNNKKSNGESTKTSWLNWMNNRQNIKATKKEVTDIHTADF